MRTYEIGRTGLNWMVYVLIDGVLVDGFGSRSQWLALKWATEHRYLND